jgi:hypothetical protein
LASHQQAGKTTNMTAHTDNTYQNQSRTGTTRQPLPRANDNAAIAVTDGGFFVGTLVERDGEHHAFDADGFWIGAFASRTDAMRALPDRGTP